MFRFFKSEFFNFEALRLLSFIPYEGCEVGEFLTAIAKIRDLDLDSWYRAWMEAGDGAEALAVEAELAGNREAARRAFFRASNYQRSAQFMLHGQDDARALRDSETSISNFWRAASLLDATVKRFEIPYEGTMPDGSRLAIQLPAYLYYPHPSKRVPDRQRKGGSSKGLPLLINMVGADATQEEIFYVLPQAALELGYAVLTFEGPGQGIVLRRHDMPFRPDWEEVVSTVLDFALDVYLPARPELPQIDQNLIALAGSSMGGYLALRGARDPRVKACIAVDPFYRMWDLLKGRIPDRVVEADVVPDWVWDNLSAFLGWWNVQTQWELKLTSWMLGAKRGSAADNFRQMRRYTLEDGQLELVHCPVFVTGARHSLYSSPEVSTERVHRELVNVADDSKAMWIGEAEGEGGLAAKAGAFGILNQKAFAWLDGVFGIERKISSSFKA